MKRLGRVIAALGLMGLLAACGSVRGADAHVVLPRPGISALLAPTNSPLPTESPTPSACPTPTPTPDLGGTAYDAYYADTVFVGDSLTVGLMRYVRRLRREAGSCLDGAAFVAGEGLSIRVLRHDNKPTGDLALLYKDEPISLTEGIRASNKRHAVILLGTNDFGGLRLEQTVENYKALLDRVAYKCPDVAVTLVAVPPVTKKFCEQEGFSIETWNAINPALEELCRERGLGFISFAGAVSDDDGYLDTAYSSDKRIHLNEQGFRAWLEALRLYAAEQLS